jgi:hypothetical protein
MTAHAFALRSHGSVYLLPRRTQRVLKPLYLSRQHGYVSRSSSCGVGAHLVGAVQRAEYAVLVN